MDAGAGRRGASRKTKRCRATQLPFEFMLNALRLKEGFELARFTERTGLPLTATAKGARRGRSQRLADARPAMGPATPRGFDFLSDLQSLFLPWLLFAGGGCSASIDSCSSSRSHRAGRSAAASRAAPAGRPGGTHTPPRTGWSAVTAAPIGLPTRRIGRQQLARTRQAQVLLGRLQHQAGVVEGRHRDDAGAHAVRRRTRPPTLAVAQQRLACQHLGPRRAGAGRRWASRPRRRAWACRTGARPQAPATGRCPGAARHGSPRAAGRRAAAWRRSRARARGAARASAPCAAAASGWRTRAAWSRAGAAPRRWPPLRRPARPHRAARAPAPRCAATPARRH